MYAHISGRVFTLAGLLSLAGVLVAAPVLYKAWNRLKETGGLPDQAELERLADGARPVLAAEPPHGPD